MKMTSVWQGTAHTESFEPLAADLQTDVVIIGAGITGIALAALLVQAGRSVVVLESSRLGSGTTGLSTGNLYATVGGRLYRLRDRWDLETTKRVVRSRAETIDWIEAIARDTAPACGFERVPHHIYATDASEQDEIQREFEAARDAGLPAQLQTTSVPFAKGPALVIMGQAQFHPLAFVQGLAQVAASAGCRIFENSPALEIDEKRGTVRTPSGSIKGREIVLATHTPKGLFALHAEMPVHREYAIAGRASAAVSINGINWGIGKQGHSVRQLRHEGQQWLVVIGSEVKTGRHDGTEELAKVERKARDDFGVIQSDFRWSAQNYQSPDRVPYIGRSLGSDVFIATGFAADGLTYGALAARIIADEITGQSNPYADLYAARRVTPVKSAARVVEENVVVMKSFLQDYVTNRKTSSLDSLSVGQGNIVEHNGDRVAAYRAEDGTVLLVSPVCTHLKCIVHWNSAERSWDCPCHGSRFAPDGQVLEGPALSPLARV